MILFDYSCQTRKYDNNIESPEQVRALCAEIAALPSAPMVFIDQEGGLVRRLKESGVCAVAEREGIQPISRRIESEKFWPPASREMRRARHPL